MTRTHWLILIVVFFRFCDLEIFCRQNNATMRRSKGICIRQGIELFYDVLFIRFARIFLHSFPSRFESAEISSKNCLAVRP